MKKRPSRRRPLLRRWAAVPLAAWLALAGPPANAQTELDSAPALAAARDWLSDLDAGRYGASWEEAAALLQGSMPKGEWETGLDRSRAPLGVVVARKIRQARCTRGTQADPEAEICIVVYDTRFENRALVDERLTLLRGRGGVWRVAAYSLR